MRRRYVALLLVLPVLTGVLHARTIYVDDDAPGDPLPFNRQIGDPLEDGSAEHPFDSIQEAIDAAVHGDTIIVAPGRYLSPDPWLYDQIDFKGKMIRLVGSAPTDFAVIERTILCGVVIFKGTEGPTCLLQGFKIQNHAHGGVLGNNTRASISHCIISGNGPCGATVLMDVRGRVANCLIVDNTTFHDCGLGPVVSGCPELVNCTIANNLSGVGVSNIGLSSRPATITIRNCIIHGNQFSQLLPHWDRSLQTTTRIEYCLIGGWSDKTAQQFLAQPIDVWAGDPCFVQPGRWVGDTLIEGDYHLKTQGWRWSPQEVHGSHWYFDPVTSPAIDAGDPIDGLGEELERAPDDPEGRWGVNHAIDLGAYGGTTQASLAPTEGEPPGVGAVDLRDYWPWDVGNRWATVVTEPQSKAWGGVIARCRPVNGFDVCTFQDESILPRTDIHLVYVDHVLYKTEDAAALDLLPQVGGLEVLYPQYLTVGSTVQVPEGLFGVGTVRAVRGRRPATVVRGSLAEVLADTAFDPNQFVSGEWPDVIAFRENTADGTPGEPLAMFARGFGPLLLNGLPVGRAYVAKRNFYVGAPLTPPARR